MLPQDYPGYHRDGNLSAFREERMEQKKKRPAILIGILIGIAIAGAVGWKTFGKYVSVYNTTEGELPVIRADKAEFRIRPKTPGGMDVPNQDKMIYDRFRKNENELPVERLLPAPEKPVLPEKELEPQGAAGKGSDPIGMLAGQIIEEETELASATILDERGKPVEVMFRAVTKETKTPQKTETVQKAEVVVVQEAPKPTPVKKADDSVFSVQLVSTRSAESAEQEWKRLSKKYAEIISGLPHTVSEVSVEKGVFYRLRVGQYKTRDEAKLVCDQLKEKKQECLVVK